MKPERKGEGVFVYPKLDVYVEKIIHNALYLQQECRRVGVELTVVTKVVRAMPEIVIPLRDAGVDSFGDSRMQNIKRLRDAGVENPLHLIRIPMLSEVDAIIEHADFVFVSEIDTLKKIVSAKGKRKTAVLFMIDVGDIREGVWYEHADRSLEQAVKIAGRRLIGLATNLGCFGGVLPDEINMRMLCDLGKRYALPTLSGGNSAALLLIEEQRLPKEINHYRVGEAVFLGTDVTRNRSVPGTDPDTFILQAEIVEIQVKPSVPVGKIGQDAFGRKPEFEDKGLRKKAIIAVGEQDVIASGLLPLDPKISVLHASSDHTILDVTESAQPYKIGEKLSFRLSYGALLRAMTSEYIFKNIVV